MNIEAMPRMIERPVVTFPEDVAAFVRDSYSEAQTVLEYGSGGSTVIAAETPGTRCYSVETDRQWAEQMSAWLDEKIVGHDVVVHYANIGETKEWGRPKVRAKKRAWRYWQYPRSVWRRRDFCHPDVVLIDGRFRVGCFLTVVSKIRRPTTILFDDYAKRDSYRVVEQICEPERFVGRMAVFHATPRALSLSEWAHFARPALASL